jgi:hypothetical protein
MQRLARTVTSWVPYPATDLAAGYIVKAGNPPLALGISHRQQHGRLSVARNVAHDVARDVAQSTVPGCYFWAAGARLISILARAAALMLRKDASGLRALGLTPASLLRTAPVSLPAPRSRRAPAGQGQSQRPSGAQDGPSRRCERSLSVRSLCASAPAPDRRPIPSLRSVIPRSAVGRASRAREAPPQSRLGALLPLSLVGTRSCFRDRISPRWGASFAFRRLGAAHHLLRPIGGLRKLRSNDARKFLPHSLRLLGQPVLCFTARAASARPKTRRVRSKPWINGSMFVQTHFPFDYQTSSKPDQRSNQPSCHSLN